MKEIHNGLCKHYHCKEALILSTTTLKLSGPKQTLYQKVFNHFRKYWQLHVLALPAVRSLFAFA